MVTSAGSDSGANAKELRVSPTSPGERGVVERDGFAAVALGVVGTGFTGDFEGVGAVVVVGAVVAAVVGAVVVGAVDAAGLVAEVAGLRCGVGEEQAASSRPATTITRVGRTLIDSNRPSAPAFRPRLTRSGP